MLLCEIRTSIPQLPAARWERRSTTTRPLLEQYENTRSFYPDHRSHPETQTSWWIYDRHIIFPWFGEWPNPRVGQFVVHLIHRNQQYNCVKGAKLEAWRLMVLWRAGCVESFFQVAAAQFVLVTVMVRRWYGVYDRYTRRTWLTHINATCRALGIHTRSGKICWSMHVCTKTPKTPLWVYATTRGNYTLHDCLGIKYQLYSSQDGHAA